jgi:hypothetical protein
VKTQIRIATSVHVLVAIVKERLGAAASLDTIRPIPSLAPLGKMPLDQPLNDRALQKLNGENPIRPNLFD